MKKGLIDAVFFLAGLLPQFLAERLGLALGWLLQHIVRLKRRDVVAHLRLAFPEWSPEEQALWLKRFYRHLGLLAMELLRLAQATDADLQEKVTIEGMEHLEAALARGKGVLVLSGHLGNWELELASLGSRGYRPNAVVKEIKTEAGNYAAERMRNSHGINLIPRRNSIRQIMQCLRRNEIVIFVLDQNMTSDEGIFVDFFGRPACTMGGLAVLAERCGAPVLPVGCYRETDMRHHRAVCQPALEWEKVGDDRGRNIRHNTQRYTRLLEEMIRAHPAQWIWMHRRWRTRPEAKDSGGE
jgi:KDO2-lipid IV(A) lauroyltransferase